MTGIAVVTTRLSSVTMKTATEVMANVHSALGVKPCVTAAESDAIDSSAWLTYAAMEVDPLEQRSRRRTGAVVPRVPRSPARVDRRVTSGRGAAEAMPRRQESKRAALSCFGRCRARRGTTDPTPGRSRGSTRRSRHAPLARRHASPHQRTGRSPFLARLRATEKLTSALAPLHRSEDAGLHRSRRAFRRRAARSHECAARAA